MRAYISVADAAECTRRRGQGAKGSGCGSGWDGASSGRTELRVDTTGGAQDWVGCHGRDSSGQITLNEASSLCWSSTFSGNLDTYWSVRRHEA